MATGKPPRRPKAQSEPVTIDLQAESSDAAGPDQGLKPEDLHADEATAAAPEGPPIDNPDDASSSDPLSDTGGEAPAQGERRNTEAQPRGPSTSSLLAAGIAGGLVSLALAASMFYAGFLPLTSTTTDGAMPAELSDRLSAVEARVSSLTTTGASSEATDLQPRIAALETAIDAVRQEASSESNEAAISSLRGELTALAETLGQLKTVVESNRQSAETTASRLAEAERKIDEPRTDVEMARAISATALKAAVDRGGPFLAELDTLAGVAPEDPAVEELRPYAATGVASRAELVRRFPDVANAILAAIHQPEESDGIGARLLSSAFSVIKVRPVGNVDGDTPEAIVARMEDKLRNGDIKGASLEWDTLPEAGKAASNDYAELLKNRVTVETLAGSAMSNAVNTNG
ncbi:COG4223 family protein [Ciceribacter sp. L1K22]|nr:COG4223 family protein [Ciceribacter sp. L1K22]